MPSLRRRAPSSGAGGGRWRCQSYPTRATHSNLIVADSIGAGQRLAGSLIDTPRPSVTHSLAERARKPLTCENVDEAVAEPAKSAQLTVVDAPRWHESGHVAASEPTP